MYNIKPCISICKQDPISIILETYKFKEYVYQIKMNHATYFS